MYPNNNNEPSQEPNPAPELNQYQNPYPNPYQNPNPTPAPNPYQNPAPYPYPQMPPKAKKGLAIAALVLGIISFLAGVVTGILILAVYAAPSSMQWGMGFAFGYAFILIFLPIMVLTALLSIIFGLISLIKKRAGKKLSLAGVILSGLVLLTIAALFIFVAVQADKAAEPARNINEAAEQQLNITDNQTVKTFTSNLSGLSLRYPANWEVELKDNGFGIDIYETTFSAPSGYKIILEEGLYGSNVTCYNERNDMLFYKWSDTGINGLAVVDYQMTDRDKNTWRFLVVQDSIKYGTPTSICNESELIDAVESDIVGSVKINVEKDGEIWFDKNSNDKDLAQVIQVLSSLSKSGGSE
ncbi:MAG: hypothetical protein LBL08_01615 [Candidatus Nomurabacteria bacterium]|jgi:hypothetical protein|nr:hypothetical protein [Candidatus Nomurabacteria bacterium]